MLVNFVVVKKWKDKKKKNCQKSHFQPLKYPVKAGNSEAPPTLIYKTRAESLGI